MKKHPKHWSKYWYTYIHPCGMYVFIPSINIVGTVKSFTFRSDDSKYFIKTGIFGLTVNTAYPWSKVSKT